MTFAPRRLFNGSAPLVALLVAGAGCSVNESGKIKCVDDSTCPSDYPVCSSGFCIEGTSTGGITAAVIGVAGKASTDPVRQTVNVLVSAKATTGVASVSLAGGSQTFTSSAAPQGALFTIPVDTTKLTDGSVTLTATVTAGDGKTGTASGTITVDNTAPTLSNVTLANGEARPNTLVTIDVTSNEKLSAIAASVLLGTTAVGQASEIAAATTSGSGEIRHLGFAVSSDLAAGTYTVSMTGTDVAGNTSTAATKTFNVRKPFTLTSLTAAGNATVGGLPAGKTGTTITATLTVPASVQAGTNKPSFTLTDAAGATRTFAGTPTSATSSSNVVWTITDAVAADSSGVATIAASLADASGNVATTQTTFFVDNIKPTLGGIAATRSFAQATQTITITGTGSEALQGATVASSNGDTGTCTADSTANPVVSCTITVTAAASNTPATATVTLIDAVGNTSDAIATQQVQYTVVAAASGTFTASNATNSITITENTTTTLTATFAAGLTATVTNSANSSVVGIASGSPILVSPAVGTTTYTLHVVNQAGVEFTPQPTVSVTVVKAPVISAFAANPGAVTAGNPSTLSATYALSAAAANSVTISNDQNGVVLSLPSNVTATPVLNTVNVTPSVTTVFTLHVKNAAGLDVTSTVTVSVGTLSATLTGTATITKGTSTNLSATYAFPAGGSATITNDKSTKNSINLTNVASPATVPVSPNQTTQYTLTVTNAAAASTSSGPITITVVDQAQMTVVPSATVLSTKVLTSFQAVVTVPNAQAAGLTTGATVSLSVNTGSNCASAGTAVGGIAGNTLTVNGGTGVGTATITGIPVLAGNADGSPAATNYCARVTNSAGLVTGEPFIVTYYAPANGSIVFKNGTNSAAAGGTATITVSNVPVSGGSTIATGYFVTLNEKTLANTGDVAFTNVLLNTNYTLSVIDPAGGVFTSAPISFTTTPVINGFTASITSATAGTNATSATVGTNGVTMTFSADFLPGGNGTATGTITAKQGAGTVNVFNGGSASTVVGVAPGGPGGVPNINFPGSTGAGTSVTFTLSVGAASLTATPSITLVNAAGTPTLSGNTTITLGSSATLNATYSNTNSATITAQPENETTTACSGGCANGTITVTPNTTGNHTYTLNAFNSLGAGPVSSTLNGVTVSVKQVALISATPSSQNVTQGTNFSATAIVNNATAAGLTVATTATLFQGACGTGSVVGSPVALTIDSPAVGQGTASFASVPAPTGSSGGTLANFCVRVANVTGNPSDAPFQVTSYLAPQFTASSFKANSATNTNSCANTATCLVAANTADVTLAATFSNGTGTITASTGAIATGWSGSATAISTLFPSITSVTSSLSFELQVVNPAFATAPATAPVVTVQLTPLTQTTNALTQRANHTATLLPNGKVLLAGGTLAAGATTTSVVYDPSTQSFTVLGNGSPRGSGGTNGDLACVRTEHSAVLLPSGKVLVAGGCADNTTTDLFDPATNTYATGPTITQTQGLKQFTLTLAPGTGGALFAVIAGGRQITGTGSGAADDSTATIETWNLNTANNFAAAGFSLSGTNGRAQHTATVLSNGKILIAGGAVKNGGATTLGLATADIIDVSSGVTAVANNMLVGRQQHAAARTSNGSVMLFGGKDLGGVVLNSVEFFNAPDVTPLAGTANQFDRTTARSGFNNARFGLTANALFDGNIVLAGGSTGSASTALDLYVPAGTGGVATVPQLFNARLGHTATNLFDGTVVILGGTTGDLKGEIYNEALP